MILTNKQQEGLKIAIERYRNHEKLTVISGYAGVGKSQLVKFIIEALDVKQDEVCYATFTGKAAEVLRKKGNPGATTLHKLLYKFVPKPNGGYRRFPKAELKYKVVVVDEVSMVPKSMIELLLKHKAYIIFLGDPEQLPQINKEEAHDLLEHPHIFLDEVMRQAQESEIIRLTMDIREGKPINFSNGKEVIVLPKKELNTGMLLWADQIICGTNKKRIELNMAVRNLLGYESELPQDGEKMICLRNYWEDFSSNGDALVNGTTGIIKNPFESFRDAPSYACLKNPRMETLVGDFIAEDGSIFEQVEMDKHMILTGQKCFEWRDEYKLGKLKNKIGDIIPREFAFGYALTGWKAQGSEWDKVLVYEENFPFDREEHKKFLYTCATRASQKLVLIRN